MTRLGHEATLLRAEGGSSGESFTSLSPAQLGAARRRLVGANLVVGGTMLGYFLLYLTVWSGAATAVGRVVAPSTVLVFAALGWLTTRARTRGRLVALAMAFHLTLGVGVGAMEPFDVLATDRPYTLISWNCVNVLLVPALLPAGTRVVVGFALALASLTPIGFALLSGVAGAPALAPSVHASLWAPPFVCALFAWVPSNLMSRLRRDLSNARKLGAYQLVRRLGAGGMGEVWEARHRFLARPAAIKLIKPELLGDEPGPAAQRFEREAQAIAALESPHTVRLYDFGVADDGAFYSVMELLRGTDLRRLVQEHGPMPPSRAAYVLKQACDSLGEAHARGLIHRDVKPANLFLGPRGQAHDVLRVLDFGLVKDQVLDGAEAVELSREGQIQGTPTTLAPEAATGKAPLDGRADLYALGCVAFYLVTGRDVFEGATALEVVVAHVSEPPPPPSACAEQPIPASFDRLVLDCLAKAPVDRVASAADLAARLDALDGVPEWTQREARAWWEAHLPDVVRA